MGFLLARLGLSGQSKGVWPNHKVVEYKVSSRSLHSGLTSGSFVAPSVEEAIGFEEVKAHANSKCYDCSWISGSRNE